MFKKTEVNPIKAFIPGVNFVEWCKLIGRKPIYALWLLFPIVNIFIFCGMAVDMVRSFGKLSLPYSALAVIYAPAAFFLLAFSESDKYVGQTLKLEKDYAQQLLDAKESNDDYKFKKLSENNPYKKSTGREWFESIVFAVFAAAFIRMFLIEAYIIPTPSMEGSLLVGDFLFVSKASYGIRTPQTIAMLPLLHNTIPGLGTESYLKSPSLPYYRLPKLGDVELHDPIVFNWPAGDSIYLTSMRSWSAYQATIQRNLQNDPELSRMVKTNQLRVRPVDKKDHYIKRCVGLPGDSLQIIDSQIFLNGKAIQNPEHMQLNYSFDVPLTTFNFNLLEKYGISKADLTGTMNGPALALDSEQIKIVREQFPNVNFKKVEYPARPLALFPNDPKNFPDWNIDNYGPIYIPKKGESVVITPNNISLYKRIIGTYEGHDLSIKNGRVLIDGKPSTSYTFEMDYYWAMGDNRHNSEDSRFWGFVPFDHIVGKPIFIWMSLKEGSLAKGIRWNRLFSGANKM